MSVFVIGESTQRTRGSEFTRSQTSVTVIVISATNAAVNQIQATTCTHVPGQSVVRGWMKGAIQVATANTIGEWRESGSICFCTKGGAHQS